jgi:excisionase family DNA binding protein
MNDPRYLSTRELGEVLGMAPITIQRMPQRGELPSVRLGGRYRFRLDEVETALRSRKTGAGKTAGKGKDDK